MTPSAAQVSDDLRNGVPRGCGAKEYLAPNRPPLRPPNGRAHGLVSIPGRESKRERLLVWICHQSAGQLPRPGQSCVSPSKSARRYAARSVEPIDSRSCKGFTLFSGLRKVSLRMQGYTKADSL